MSLPEAAKHALSFGELERSLGKKVMFNFGKHLQEGTLIGVDKEIYSVTVRAVIRGRTMKIRIELPKQSVFALIEDG